MFFDPTRAGSGAAFVNLMLHKLQPSKESAMNYLRQLAAQQPIFLNDSRLHTEWVARGKYPIALGASFQVVTDFVSNGAPIKRVHTAEGTLVSPAAGTMTVPARPPHPNASTVFVNFIMGEEGQRYFAEAFGASSMRVGVKTRVLDPSAVPYPGDKLVFWDEETLVKAGEARETAKLIFGPLMK